MLIGATPSIELGKCPIQVAAVVMLDLFVKQLVVAEIKPKPAISAKPSMLSSVSDVDTNSHPISITPIKQINHRRSLINVNVFISFHLRYTSTNVNITTTSVPGRLLTNRLR